MRTAKDSFCAFTGVVAKPIAASGARSVASALRFRGARSAGHQESVSGGILGSRSSGESGDMFGPNYVLDCIFLVAPTIGGKSGKFIGVRQTIGSQNRLFPNQGQSVSRRKYGSP